MRRSVVIAIIVLAGCKHGAAVQEPVHEEPAPEVGAACDALPEDACRARSDCAVITAQQHIVDHPCALEPQAVGCMSADQACGDAITFARDGDNNVWWFMDTCTPAGFTQEPYPQGLSEPPPSC
jgi:hypothetical protein